MTNTLLHSLSSESLRFGRRKSKPPRCGGFLSSQALVHQASPSGRVLITHAAKASNVDRLKLLLPKQPRARMGPIATLLRAMLTACMPWITR